MLKALEVIGFKSFAKKANLSFGAPITAIVGPNGSGKSNVAESFRFVLGEQSMKSMRGKRGEDLIWNGSEEVGRSNRAAVKLTFDNSKRIFDLDFDEVVMERVVERSGVNEYFINGSQVRLKDTLELLGRAHIGASGHHIISQGEADRILRASPKERREMIEDALGLKAYEYKKSESERKLEKTHENIAQVESLRREIAPHIKYLKKQVEKLEKGEELRNKLEIFYKEYLKREQVYIKHEHERINKQMSPLKERAKELDHLMQEARTVLESSQKKDEKSTELIRIEQSIGEARREKDTLEREQGKIEGEILSNERSISRLRELALSTDTKTIRLKEVDNLLSELSAHSKNLDAEPIESLREIVRSVFRKIAEFVDSHRDKVDTGAIDELVSRNEVLSKDRESRRADSERVSERLTTLESEYTRIRTAIEQEKDSSREAEKAIFKISSEQSEARSSIKILEEQERSLSLIEEEWKREIQEGGVLLGTRVLHFSAHPLVDHNGVEIALQDIYSEDRHRQDDRKRELEKMKIRLEELGAAGGEDTMKEYRDATERDEFLAKELEDLYKSSESLKALILELEQKLDTQFKEGIEKINKSFHDFFTLMFGGGSAKIEVAQIEKRKAKKDEDLENTEADTEEANEEGVDIAVTLPRKRIKGLDMLSGGERALTSIALLFAISQVNPPPFIILDETDAALDEANSKKYGDMIEELAKYSQLILITHNRETMSRAGIIYGVTMGRDGVSKLLSIAFNEAVAVAK
jgi:chromosome segregation protein